MPKILAGANIFIDIINTSFNVEKTLLSHQTSLRLYCEILRTSNLRLLKKELDLDDLYNDIETSVAIIRVYEIS